jgi:hypothetical protein
MRVLLSGCVLIALIAPGRAAEPDEQWWALRPVLKPNVPGVTGATANRIRNPIDAFVLAKLKEKGLSPAPEADSRTLIRRLSFDLLGLPPTPEEIVAFVKACDGKPQAVRDAEYEKLVNRLLASPHYGERWARHWMDVVHFAETHGHDQDRVRPNAWPYRDYLIEAFNSDRPYAQFVKEQIAADVLFPNEPQRLPALGMLAAGPWDESSLRDIREDSIDRQIGHYLDRDDIVSNVMSTFSSVTIHCARCHDHKFDPISQEDYYSLQADFAGVGRAERPFDADAAVARKRQELRQKLAALTARDAKILAELASPALQDEIKAWESKSPRAVVWTVLEPATFTSANGVTLTKLADKSILAGGMRPERDVYTITAANDLQGITAVRLELMTDDSLPHHGPGRQDNGNLHLNEFRIKAAPKIAPEKARPIAIANATADFDQQGWTVRQAIDNQPGTAWGIYPEVGKAHYGVFELKDEIGATDGTLLTFILEQQHGGGHLIGRLRLSVTTSPKPVRITKFPDAVAKALAIDLDKRTTEQKFVIASHYLKEKLELELAKLPPPKMVYAVAHDFKPDGSHKPPPKPRLVHILKRGDINRPMGEAGPGALECVSVLTARFDLKHPDDETARRAALAQWLADEKNPLTWRSIVNRVWHYHFGRGIVDSPNDFGKMGGRPTHPELLDYLAFTFREQGGSMKMLHRLIVTSSTYRQSCGISNSESPATAVAGNVGSALFLHPKFANRNPQSIDVDNRFLWRMNRSRLDAESVRDAILLVSERLNRTGGGPSDQQFSMRPGIHVTPLVDYRPFEWDRPEGHRRSVYRFIFRTLPDPFIACLDGADASQLTPARNTSITPLQALSLLNNDFIVAHSKAFAASLEKASKDRDRQIAIACQRIWGRTPTDSEREEMKTFANKHGMANLCRLLFNSNEFLFVN